MYTKRCKRKANSADNVILVFLKNNLQNTTLWYNQIGDKNLTKY